MSFASPWLLALLVAIPAIVAAYVQARAAPIAPRRANSPRKGW